MTYEAMPTTGETGIILILYYALPSVSACHGAIMFGLEIYRYKSMPRTAPDSDQLLYFPCAFCSSDDMRSTGEKANRVKLAGAERNHRPPGTLNFDRFLMFSVPSGIGVEPPSEERWRSFQYGILDKHVRPPAHLHAHFRSLSN